MPKIKLTERAIERLRAPHPDGKQTLYWDTELKGFGVLVSGTTNAKTYIAQRRLPNGRQRRITIEATNALALDKARGEAELQLHDLRIGNDPKAGKRGAATLKQTLDDYLAARKTLRQRSGAAYRQTIEGRLADWLTMPIRDITPEMVERRHTSIQAGVAKREEARRAKAEKRAGTQREDETAIRRTGHASANGTMVALRVLWNFAAERDPAMAPMQNPVRRLKKAWFEVARRTRCIRPDELPAFYEAVGALENRTARDYLLLLLFTGFRRTEAASLRWTDVDLQGKVIRLPAKRTKAGRALDLPMSDFVHDLLVARRALGRDGEFVFASHGKAGYIAEPKAPLTEVAKKTGIYVSAHDLRRTFVTVAESTEISVYALKALVNHAAGGDVTSGYVVLTTERLREAAQRVTNRMKELCGVMPPKFANLIPIGGLQRAGQ